MIWDKVAPLFTMASVNTEVFSKQNIIINDHFLTLLCLFHQVTQRRFHAREIMQSLDLAQYDGLETIHTSYFPLNPFHVPPSPSPL